MRVAIYARCSTQEQSVDLQVDALRDYAAARGFEIVHEYVDEAVSGAKAKRPALDQLLADAHRRRFDVVACWKLDRLARSVRHLTALAGEFEALGVGLVVLDQAIDTTTPTGRLLFHVLGAIGEFELALIRERTVAGIRAARRRGKRIGRPRVHVPRERALALLRRGKSVSAVALELGIARTTLQRALPKTVSPAGVLSP